MTCTRSHRIELTNLSDDELVTHTILLVKGQVYQNCAVQQQVQLELRNANTAADKTQKQQQQQQQQQNQQQQQSLTTTLSHRGEFKFLLDLNAYEEACQLRLNVSYCNTTVAVQLQYAPQLVNSYRVQPLLIRCCDEIESDNERNTAAYELIDLNLRLVQCVYAEKIREAGFPRRTFTLNDRCALFHSQLSVEAAWQASEDALWEQFAHELLNSVEWGECKRLKFVAFIACTRYDGAGVMRSGDVSYANIRKHLHAHAALGGGGLALFGSAYFYAWPQRFDDVLACFRSEVPVDLSIQPDDSNYRRTLGGVYASTLGAVAHEVGHIFDLAHTDDGVMGKGFDLINRVFTVPQSTEHLPTRIIQKGTLTQSPTTALATRPRFTQLRSQKNNFLDDYREQRQNDAFFFTRNCAVILSHHKWLRCLGEGDDNYDYDDEDADVDESAKVSIQFDSSNLIVSSSGAPLKLIELRANSNSLVTNFYELPAPTATQSILSPSSPSLSSSFSLLNAKEAAQSVYSFQLPEILRQTLNSGTHNLFVLTENGQMKRFNMNSIQQQQAETD